MNEGAYEIMSFRTIELQELGIPEAYIRIQVTRDWIAELKRRTGGSVYVYRDSGTGKWGLHRDYVPEYSSSSLLYHVENLLKKCAVEKAKQNPGDEITVTISASEFPFKAVTEEIEELKRKEWEEERKRVQEKQLPQDREAWNFLTDEEKKQWDEQYHRVTHQVLSDEELAVVVMQREELIRRAQERKPLRLQEEIKRLEQRITELKEELKRVNEENERLCEIIRRWCHLPDSLAAIVEQGEEGLELAKLASRIMSEESEDDC